jgi:hypothetical protein
MDAKTEVSITLLAEEWNVVLDVMADGRHRIVAPIIQRIVAQAQANENAAPPMAAARPNGAQLGALS